MEKVFNILEIRFESEQITINLNGQILSFRLSDISEKLSRATLTELQDYKISPSGYGIHWKQLDEDISINGLLELKEKKKYTATYGIEKNAL
ncbi:MAG: DUF2442 domain-containing protein [Bacteroidales bacterium]